MSEIASKANSRPSSSQAQTLVKKSGDAAHEMVFAELFGGVIVAETQVDPLLGGLAPVNADAHTDNSQDGNSNILAGMQAVAAMMSGQHSKSPTKGSDADFVSRGDAILEDEGDLANFHGEPAESTIPANPMMIGPMPSQQQVGTSRQATKTVAVMTQMPLEDDATMPHQHTGRTVPSIPIPHLHLSSAQSQMRMAASSSSSSGQNVKSTEKAQKHAGAINDMLIGDFDIETRQLGSGLRPGGWPAFKPATYQQNISQTSLANSRPVVGSDHVLTDLDGNVQFDSPENFTRVVAGQTARSRDGIIDKSVSGESLSANAVRQMQTGGLSIGAQVSQQNNGQSGGFISASAGMTNGSMMDMLDMAQDNWTEMLLQRVERGLAGGKDKIDFHLSPRNLGKMRVSLIIQNERTHVRIQTETSAAAHLLNDAEARLVQMMDASGLKFGNLTSQYSQNFGGSFGGQNSGQGREGGSANATPSDTPDGKDDAKPEISVDQKENLINMQA